VGVSNEVDPRDVDPDGVRRSEPRHLPAQVGRGEEQRSRDDSVGQHSPRTVEVVEERLERSHALRDA
jgi:hypothetical protein